MTNIDLEDSSLITPTAGLIRNVCVYCGSSQGAEPLYIEAAAEFGRVLAAAHIGLVYGGGNTGLMGAIARSALAHGGFVTGIIPQFLTDREVALEEAQNLIVVPDMHKRKQLMFEKADAFVALPGGVGTLEALVELKRKGKEKGGRGVSTSSSSACRVAGPGNEGIGLLEHQLFALVMSGTTMRFCASSSATSRSVKLRDDAGHKAPMGVGGTGDRAHQAGIAAGRRAGYALQQEHVRIRRRPRYRAARPLARSRNKSGRFR